MQYLGRKGWKKMFEKRINKSLQKAYNNALEENKYLREQLKKQIEDSIMTINEVQDIQSINISEAEKDMMRNSIINKKRTDYVTKILKKSSKGDKMPETLEELEQRYFMLQMQDVWDSSDYRYADELRQKINELKEAKNGLISTSETSIERDKKQK